jgi:hypothetical protein
MKHLTGVIREHSVAAKLRISIEARMLFSTLDEVKEVCHLKMQEDTLQNHFKETISGHLRKIINHR